MATFRVGVGSFNIQDGAVGFGTDTDGLGNLKVKGVTKTTGSIVSGASTLTRYSGFAADNINQLENITLTSEVGTIGDIVVGVGTSVIISSASTVTVGTVESVSIGTHFSPPVGGTEERGEDFVEGMMRFNMDLNTMEFYNGNEWRQFTYISDIQNSPSSRGRALIAGGENSPSGTDFKIIEYLQTSTLGTSRDFGELTNTNMQNPRSLSNSIRALFGGGQPTTATIDYTTIASEGNGIDFGDLSSGRPRGSGLASSTRGIFVGGNPGVNIMDYVEIMTLGNALDFGDLSFTGKGPSATASPTHGIITNDYSSSDSIDKITIASKGNGITFGKDLYYGGYGATNGASTGTRGIWMGGYTSSTGTSPTQNLRRTTAIRGVEFSSGGTATEYGDLVSASFTVYNSATGTKNRGFCFGGFVPEVTIDATNVIQFMNIQSGGDAQDFGDLVKPRYGIGSVCDSHGGLGGY